MSLLFLFVTVTITLLHLPTCIYLQTSADSRVIRIYAYIGVVHLAVSQRVLCPAAVAPTLVLVVVSHVISVCPAQVGIRIDV